MDREVKQALCCDVGQGLHFASVRQETALRAVSGEWPDPVFDSVSQPCSTSVRSESLWIWSRGGLASSMAYAKDCTAGLDNSARTAS